MRMKYSLALAAAAFRLGRKLEMGLQHPQGHGVDAVEDVEHREMGRGPLFHFLVDRRRDEQGVHRSEDGLDMGLVVQVG